MERPEQIQRQSKFVKQNCCSKVLDILNQPVHVGEYWNDATESVEILDQSFVEFQDEVIIGDGAEVGGPLGEARVDVGHEVGVELVAVLLAHALVHSRVHLLVGDGFVGAGGMGQHLQCHGRFSTESREEFQQYLVNGIPELTPENISVIFRTHVAVYAL